MSEGLKRGSLVRLAVAVVLAGLFWFSLNQDAVLACPGPPVRGLMIAEVGWMGPMVLQFGWYANLGLAWVVVRLLSGGPMGFWSAAIATLSFVVALTAFTWKDIPSDVAYNSQQVCGFGLGFDLWIATLALSAVATIAFSVIDNRSSRSGSSL